MVIGSKTPAVLAFGHGMACTPCLIIYLAPSITEIGHQTGVTVTTTIMAGAATPALRKEPLSKQRITELKNRLRVKAKASLARTQKQKRVPAHLA